MAVPSEQVEEPTNFDQVHRTFDSYAQELLWIRDKAGGLIPFQFNRMQQMVLERKRRDLAEGKAPRWLILKYRRGGMSTLEIGANLHRVCTFDGQNTVTLAHSDRQTVILFRIAETFYSQLEPELRPSRTSSNKREIDLPEMRSLYYIGTARSGGFGRGDTIQRVHWSEVAWSKVGDGLMTGLDKACSHGSFTMESTANGPGGLFFDMVTEAATTTWGKWNLIFLPWFVDDTNRIPLIPGEMVVPGEPHNDIPAQFCEGEEELVRLAAMDWDVTVTPEMLKWRREEWANTKPSTDLFPQEFPETWRGAFVAIQGLFFDAKALAMGLAHCPPPIVKETKWGGEFLAWKEPKPDRDYVAGADTSEGRQGGDACYLSIIDWETGEQVARWHGWAEPHIFGGEVIPHYCERYNNAFAGIERNNHGHAVILACTTIGEYWNLYTFTREVKGKEPEEVYGWVTDKQSRPTMLDYTKQSMSEGWMVVNDPIFWGECFNFTAERKLTDGSTRYAGLGKNRDDSIMGHSIGLQMRSRRSVLRIRS